MYSYLKYSLEGEALSVIGGLPLTEGNFETALSMLTDRYGRKDLLIQNHISALLSNNLASQCQISASVSSGKSVALLCQFQDEILSHIRSLEALGIKGTQTEVFLCPIILSRLPQDLRLEWFKLAGNVRVDDLEALLKFLNNYIYQLDSAERYKPKKENSS